MDPNPNTDEATANREAVARFLFDMPSGAEPVADYVTDLDQRCQLFDELRRLHQTFVIWAENPEDLPSFELLEIQWNLRRVAAICGAANVTDASYYELDDDDDEVCNLITSGGDETATTGQKEKRDSPAK